MPLRLLRLAALAATTVAVAAGCSSQTHPVNRAGPTRTLFRSPPPSASSTIAVPPPAWQPGPAAVAVAVRYVTAALSYAWNRPPNAWMAEVGPLCTAQWDAELGRSADGGDGGWAAIRAEHAAATATIVAVYAAAGPGPGQRLEVTASVTTTSSDRTIVTGAAMFVDVLPQPKGHWVIGWAG